MRNSLARRFVVYIRALAQVRHEGSKKSDFLALLACKSLWFNAGVQKTRCSADLPT